MALGEAVIKVTADASGVEAGVGKAKKSLATLSQTAGQTSDAMTAANEKTSRSIDRFVQKQQLAAATLGKSASEAKLFELAQRGASAAQLKAADAALRAVDAYTRQEAAAVRAQAAAARFGMVIAAGSVLAAAAILNIGRNSVNALDQFNDLSDATGASVENISALDRVARENGQAFDSTASILVRFNKVLTDTDDEGKKAAQVFKALGLDAEALKRLDPAEALRQSAVALAQFANDGDKARAVQLLFGKSVQEAAPFLKDLAEKTSLVGTASTQAAKDAEEFNKNLFRLKANAADAARSLTADLLPALNKLFEKSKNEGFFALFGFDKEFFEKKRLAGLAGDVIFLDRELKRLKAGVATGILGPEALTQIDAVTAALEKAKGVFREADKGFTPSTAGAGRGSVNPAFVTPSLGTIPDAPKTTKDPLAEAKQYLESLQKQLQLAKEMTVYEKLLDDLKAKRFAVTPGLQKELEAAAKKVDLTKAQAKSEEDLIRTRDRAAQMQAQSDDAALANVETQIQTNQQLRDEIELMGLEGQARASVEKARLSSAIALKEEQLVMAQNAEASATVITSLEREIALLKERAGLIGQRANVQEGIDLSKATEKERQQFAEDMKSDLSGAFQAAFKSTDNPIKAFGDTLAATVFDRLSKAASDALADAVLGQIGGGSGGWGGLISSIFGSVFGGGGGVGDAAAAGIGGGGFEGGGYTGNGARSGGLDGKGGFMAMLHPKETVLDHTRGQGMGGGNSYTFNNNFVVGDVATISTVRSEMDANNRRLMGALDRQQRYRRG